LPSVFVVSLNSLDLISAGVRNGHSPSGAKGFGLTTGHPRLAPSAHGDKTTLEAVTDSIFFRE
jgi:hypothetical protein